MTGQNDMEENLQKQISDLINRISVLKSEFNNEIERLKIEKISVLESQLKEHQHDGIIGAQINVRNIFDLLRTITDATELTNVTAQPAKNIYEQMFIDTSTATKKLYVFDATGNVWRSVTIA